MDNSNNPNSPNNQNPIQDLGNLPASAPTAAPIQTDPTFPPPAPTATSSWPSSPQSTPPVPEQTTSFPTSPGSAPISAQPSEPLLSNQTPPINGTEPSSVPTWPSVPIQSEPPTAQSEPTASTPSDPTSAWASPGQSVPEPITTSSINAPLQETTTSEPAIQPNPTSFPTPSSNEFSQPTPPDYSSPSPTEPTQFPQDPIAAWTPPAQTPSEPESLTSEQPTAPINTEAALPGETNQTANGPQPALSPLDNPWGSPTQPPPIDEPQTSTQPSWTNTTDNPQPEPANQTPPTPAEAAPTDLSHLITNNSDHPPTAQPSTPETLVVPSNTGIAPEVPNIPTENHKGIPIWLIGLGVGLLILVAGASAYFILGVGQPPKTASLPATTTAPKVNEVKPPAPIATPVTQTTPVPTATGSASFGQVQGGSQQATSAADLLRQRQLQGR